MKVPSPTTLATLCLLGLCALGASCAGTPQTPQTRQAYVTELMQAYDVEGTVRRSQADSFAEAHRNIERLKDQFADLLAHMSAEQRGKFEAATDRFVNAARATADVNEAARVWAQGFITDLTDENLKKIVDFARTDAGKAQIAGANYAATQLAAYLAQKRTERIDKATQQYVSEIRALGGH
jgi:hypothetical protein